MARSIVLAAKRSPEFDELRHTVSRISTNIDQAILERGAFALTFEMASALNATIMPRQNKEGCEVSFRFNGSGERMYVAKEMFGCLIGWGATFGDAVRNLQKQVANVIGEGENNG